VSGAVIPLEALLVPLRMGVGFVSFVVGAAGEF